MSIEMYLEYSNDVITQLKEKYKFCDFEFRLAQFNVDISVFYVLTNSASLSEENLWESISKEIALKYQSKLKTVFEKWNLYIIYVTSDVSPKELKNKIENNKFSSRKIVEDSFVKEFNDDEANRLIEKHITNADLKETIEATQEVTNSPYHPVDRELWKLLSSESKIIRDRKAQEEFLKKINSL